MYQEKYVNERVRFKLS